MEKSLRGDMSLALWRELDAAGAYPLDVREPWEYNRDSIDGAVNTPLGQLRANLGDLQRDREIWVSCEIGQRTYYACRLLARCGFHAHHFSGGYETYRVPFPQG